MEKILFKNSFYSFLALKKSKKMIPPVPGSKNVKKKKNLVADIMVTVKKISGPATS